MTKNEFIRRVAADHDEPICSAAKWVNYVFASLRDCILDNPTVMISGFGKWEHRPMKECQITLPRGEVVEVPARVKLKFTPSKYVGGAVSDGIDSMMFADRMNKINALLRGEHVPGYRLYGDGRLMEIEETDPLMGDISE